MKFVVVNLGCKVNAYESRAIASLMLKKGYILGTIKDFDIAIINTCTVTHVASQKSRQRIRRMRLINKKAIIVVMGCYANNNASKIIEECGADIVVGVDKRKDIINLIDQFLLNKEKKQFSPSLQYLRKEIKYEELGTISFNENTRAYVKIEDGCDNFCSYCIIPYTRGKTRSRSKKAILNEIKHLLDLGYKEIVLTGIDTSSYGKEFTNYCFSNLLEDILVKFPTLYRLRISSIEISKIDDLFLSLLKKYNNIANHLHIPLQNGSNHVLKDMNRKYTTLEFEEKIKKIYQIRKDIAITTDVIVGYPSESEEDFNNMCEFIKKIGFMELHVFPFSPRKNTLAYRLKDLSPDIKKERVKKLIRISKELKEKYYNRFVGKELEVLFEKNNEGLTSNYIRLKDNGKSNEVKKVLIKKENFIY